MYLDHFGLREPPFRLTPLTEFFFAGAKRGATVDALVYAVLHDEGIVKVSGEVGAGKTMLCRVLIERLPDKVDTVYFANPTLAPEDLLLTVARELGLEMSSGRAGVLLSHIQDELIKRHAAGRRVVALIDEAHAMPRDSLEQIRLLSNLETGRHKLLQIVMFGQPELDAILGAHVMRPLKDRITHHFNLDPLSSEEVTDYLDFRMRAAGFRGPTVFSPASARKIARYAAGLTRRVNVLADKALLAAFSENLHAVNPAHVKIAARDAQYLPRKMRRPGWLIIPTAFLISAAFAWQAFSHMAGAPAGDETRAPVHDAANSPRSGPTLPSAPAPDHDAPPNPDDPRSTMRAEPPATERATPETSLSGQAERGTASASRERATDNTGASRPTGSGSQAEPPLLRAQAPMGTSGTAVDRAESALSTWLDTVVEPAWFIQLHTNTNATPDQLDAQVEQAVELLDQPVRVYRAELPTGERTGVITGEYHSEQEAYAALEKLPSLYRSGGAYVRPIRHLK